MKIKIKREDMRSHNPVAQMLCLGQFRRRVVRNKRAYTRKGRRKENHTTDSPFESIREEFRES